MRRINLSVKARGPSERRNTQNGRQRPNDQGGTTVEENFRTIASLLLAIAMFFSLIPALPASAANGALYFHFSNLSTDPNSQHRRTGIPLRFRVPNGINPNTISYEIKRFDDTTTGGTGVKPILDEAQTRSSS